MNSNSKRHDIDSDKAPSYDSVSQEGSSALCSDTLKDDTKVDDRAMPLGAQISNGVIKSKIKSVSLFFFIVALWLVIDIATKVFADTHRLGETFGFSIPGIIECRLVHNTGGAWGIFSDSTAALGALSVVICLAILAYVLFAKHLSRLSIVSLALIFAGGVGNAIDRFTHGYVVDFLSTTFIDFPVFNVADIGVTCGIVLFVISIFTMGDNDSGETGSHAKSGVGENALSDDALSDDGQDG